MCGVYGLLRLSLSILDNGVDARVFSQLDDVDLSELDLSFGGRKVLKRLCAKVWIL